MTFILFASSSWSSDETGSVDSGSSIDTHVDDLHLFTHIEESRIRRSLQRKLLSNNGVRLSGIERRLLRADHPGKGAVSVSTFKAALAAASRSENGADIRHDEVLWLLQRLVGRNGKNVAIMKIRELLENKENGGRVQRHHWHRDRCDTTRRGSGMSRGTGTRHRSGESTSDDDGEDWAGRRGRTTSESDSSGRGDAAFASQLLPTSSAGWTVRQGTVGQWLHDVAAPMVSFKFTFV